MDFTQLRSFNKVFPLYVEKYELFGVDENSSITEKINSMVQALNRFGRLSNDVVKDWNKVMEWAMGEGLDASVDKKVEDMILSGKFDEILQTSLTEFNGRVDSVETQLAQKVTKGELSINVKDYGAKGDGVTNDTPAFNDAIAFARANGRNLIKVPEGNYRVNLTLIGLGLNMIGSGVTSLDGVYHGTKLMAFDKTKPILQVGDGTTLTTQMLFEKFTIDGEDLTTYGVYINGVDDITFNDFSSLRCTNNNIHITSSVRHSSKIYFNNLISNYAHGSCFYAEWGQNYTTAVYINNYYSIANESYPLTSTSITIDSIALYLDNAYIDCPNFDNSGIIIKSTLANSYPKICGHNIAVDNVQHGKVVINLPAYASTSPFSWFQGVNMVTNGGTIKYSDGVIKTLPDPITILGNTNFSLNLGYTNMFGPLKFLKPDNSGSISTISPNGNNMEIINSVASSEILIKPGNGGRTKFYGGGYWVPLYMEYGTIKNYFFFDANGNLRTKQVTDDVTQKPANDTDGLKLARNVSVPTTATATGQAGDYAYDTSYMYICTATNTWKRTAIATW